MAENLIEQRPWGTFEILVQEPDYKVKKITVLPAKRLSLQYHNFRSEHWVIASGTARAVCGNKSLILAPGDSIDIPVKTDHRIENTGKSPLIFIELQRGEQLREDDIVRKEDDFGRCK